MKNPGFLAIVVAISLLVISCAAVPNTTPEAPPDTPTETQIPPTITPTSTPGPTVTPRPTDTSTPLPGWIINFTEPILNAIADRPPTYDDDFSDRSSGWHNGPTSGHPNVLISGEKRYDNGEYHVTANGATADEPIVCSGVEDRNVGRYTDFVLEFDVRFVAYTGGDWQLQFLRSDAGLFKIQLGHDGQVGFGKCDFGLDGCPGVGVSFGNAVKSGGEWNHIQLIVQGAKMAAYVNGVPSLYAEDEMATSEPTRGFFSINSCNPDPTPLETRWDNFRLWDISDLP
jgi:hypothetical protein